MLAKIDLNLTYRNINIAVIASSIDCAVESSKKAREGDDENREDHAKTDAVMQDVEKEWGCQVKLKSSIVMFSNIRR